MKMGNKVSNIVAMGNKMNRIRTMGGKIYDVSNIVKSVAKQEDNPIAHNIANSVHSIYAPVGVNLPKTARKSSLEKR